MERAFSAPRDLVFRVLTRSEHIAKWYAPSFVSLVSCESDPHVGGQFRYVLRDEAGTELRYSGTWTELVESERIAYTEVFSTPDFTAAETRVRIDLIDLGGRTLLRSLTEYESRASRDAVVEAGVEIGACESMDQAERLLAALQAKEDI